MGCVNTNIDEELLHDMIWTISGKSEAIQLKELIPLDILYKESHGSGESGSIWDNHHKSFAKYINKFNPSSIFEIGGGHGRLAKAYRSYGDIAWTILEPNPTPDKNNKAVFIKGFFDKDFVYEDKFDTVVHSHVFEHLYDLDTFMKDLSNFIDDGKRLIFTLPNMQKMLEKKYTNCLNFEHTVFLTEPYIEFLLAKYKFQIIHKEYFMEDHSIFYSALKDRNCDPKKLSNNLYKINKNIYNEYIAYHDKLISSLNSQIDNIDSPLYLFGAHIFSQYLISSGLQINKIKYLLDNDQNKQGKRLYGTPLMVESPEILEFDNNPVVILKAGVYNDEIKNDIITNINSDTNFLE